MTTVARTSSMPKLTGIAGIIGGTSQPQPGRKPSIHQPNPPTGNTINHGLTIHSLCLRQVGLARAANVTPARMGPYESLTADATALQCSAITRAAAIPVRYWQRLRCLG